MRPAERAARLETARKARIDRRAEEREERDGLDNLHFEAGSGAWPRYRCRHIVVDEAPDLSAAHWKTLRAMVPSEPDDIFLVGDTHQRIYDNQVTLGVHIRGRSSRLTLSYRTTRKILRDAIRVLGGVDYDDLDGNADTLDGYRSVLHGTEPSLRGARSWDEEMDLVVGHLRAWHDVPRESTAICVPTNDMVTQIADRLARSGITPSEITQYGPRCDQDVHISTMYRIKGLEYRCLIIAGASDGLVPRAFVGEWGHTDPSRHQRELDRAQSLLFVAATRARDALATTWHGEPSRFLAPLLRER